LTLGIDSGGDFMLKRESRMGEGEKNQGLAAVSQREIKLIKAVLVLTLICYFAGINNVIQEIDPAQYAEIAREMLESKNWLVLRDNYGPYLDKPPVTFWLIASSFKIFGVNNFGFRFPTVICAILSVLALGRIARILYDRSTALISMLIIATSEAYFLMVGDPKIDMFMVLFLVLSFWAYFESRNMRILIYLFYLFAGLAVMTKGPIGLMIPVIAISAEWLISRDLKEIRRLKLVPGIIILTITILPWYLVLYQETGEYGPYFMLFEQSFGRIFVRTYRNETTPFYFAHTFLWAFLPWSIAVLFMLFFYLRNFLKSRINFQYQPRRILLFWFIIPFLFISASSYKLPQYLFWLLPPLSVFLSDFFLKICASGKTSWLKHLSRAQMVLSVCLIAIILLMLVFCFPVQKLWVGLILVIGFIGWLYLFFLKGQFLKYSVIFPACSIMLFNLIFYVHIYPETLNYQYGDKAGKILKKIDPAGKAVYYVYPLGLFRALAFYSGRRVEQVEFEQIKNYADKRPIFLVVQESRLNRVKEHLEDDFQIEEIASFYNYHTSRPTLKFLLKKTRPKTLGAFVLLKIYKPQ